MYIHCIIVIMKSKLTRWGNSLAIRIPSLFIKHLDLASGTEIEMKLENDRLVLSRHKNKKYDLKELIENITPENRHEMTDWGPPVGKEIW